jgi:hypothetical protein
MKYPAYIAGHSWEQGPASELYKVSGATSVVGIDFVSTGSQTMWMLPAHEYNKVNRCQ